MNGKILMFTISLMLCIATKKTIDMDKYYLEKIYQIAKDAHCNRPMYKAKKVMHYAKKWGHPFLLAANLIDVESEFNEYARNKASGAIGLCQILTNIHVNYKGGFDIDKNLDYGFGILKTYYFRSYSYEKALKIFGGWTTTYGKKRPKQRDKYLKDVLQ